MTDKSKMYQSTTNIESTNATTTVRLGNDEHVVVSPKEMQQMRLDLKTMNRSIEQLKNEVSNLKNRIQSIERKKPLPPMQTPWE